MPFYSETFNLNYYLFIDELFFSLQRIQKKTQEDIFQLIYFLQLVTDKKRTRRPIFNLKDVLFINLYQLHFNT